MLFRSPGVTSQPNGNPAVAPTPGQPGTPTINATPGPTALPTPSPTAAPTSSPTGTPTVYPTPGPTAFPTPSPTAAPSSSPTGTPTVNPTPGPTALPTPSPTAAPTSSPTGTPTANPTSRPTPVPLGSISGTVTEDTDNDDIGNVGIGGVTITLLNTADLSTLTTVTDNNGVYVFYNLPVGTYVVKETNLPRYVDVTDVFGSPLDNMVNVTLTGGENKTGRDFVDERLGSISGNVMEDVDNDNIGDLDLARVNITLLDINKKAIVSTLTDNDGNYIFYDLPAGTYTVVEKNLPTYLDVSDVEGNPLDNEILVVLPSGQNITDRNYVDELPTASPTPGPTGTPTANPTPGPTALPTPSPTAVPSSSPTGTPDRKSVV